MKTSLFKLLVPVSTGLFLAAASSSSCGGGESGSGGSSSSSTSGHTGGGGSSSSGDAGADASPPPSSVTVHLETLSPGATTVSFGLPVPPGALASADTVS